MTKRYQAILFTESGSFLYSRTLGVHRIANVLRQTFQWNVLVLDHFTLTQCHNKYKNLLDQVILPKVITKETKLVGFSTTFMNFNNRYLIDNQENSVMEHPIAKKFVECLPFIDDNEAEKFFNYIRELSPNVKIVVGGTKAESRKYVNLIDAHVIGYSERQIVDLVNFWENKNKFFPIKKLSDRCLEVSHDSKGSLYDFSSNITRYCEDDVITNKETLPIEISRGCIFRCKFCAFPLNGKKRWDYIKQAEVLKTELQENYDKWQVTNYIIVDDTFNDSVEKLEMFNDVIQSLPFKIQYGAYLRHDLLAAHPQMIDLLRESGLVQASFGIETLIHESGKAIGKGMSPEKTIEILHKLRNEWPDVSLFSGFILGLPHDTEEKIYKMLDTIVDEDFPLDGMNIVPLWIDPSASNKKIFYSEFEKNWSQYGYTFPQGGVNWHLNELSYVKCNEIAIKYHENSIRTGRNKVSAFAFMSAMNYGYTKNQLKHLSWKSFNSLNNDVTKRINLVDNYYQKLLKLIE